MNTNTKVEVEMKDGSTKFAVDVIETLIESEVINTIAEVGNDYDLTKREDIITLSEMIACHLEASTKIHIHPSRVICVFLHQLKRN
ncbi:TPA: hypothetical protein NU789_001545 [Acinetobacter baumannii]|uniref:hypothetical protein n=1 Tax=Acinetobacter baumannii TaxID=470 RepID=UPI0002BAB6A8|nr:hypothetical protein [Acinetobacter baumannii]EJB8467275.1 hypothetical protein [Acinetobacter baumannii]EKU4532623.1 hypothetical protein [Acinetobacter baumannii]EKU4536278.1 hypothetical protein [Acinetobacter baumannii]EKW5259716.1 hypothetical protein [Acinetobacter baumannii]EKX0726553.1 hypothetical protein [Acinetobacter baumannii]